MQDKETTAYLVEQLKAVLAIDSPSGYTKDAADYVAAEYRRLGFDARPTVKGLSLIHI